MTFEDSAANPTQPLVSAVIPTRFRPDLVCRAVRSVLTQTYPNVEVIVVVDGPDESTLHALESFADLRVRVISLSDNVGGSEARNVGVRAATGEFVALLDDDDEWMPQKLAAQVRLALTSKTEKVFVACKYIMRTGSTDMVLPSVIPTGHQDISEYLFCTRNVFGPRLGFLQTSTWLVSRTFLLSVPFTKGLRRNQDTDWLLRALQVHPHSFLFVNDALAVFYAEPNRKRISTSMDWKDSYKWALGNRQLFSRKALSYFLITVCCEYASREKQLVSALFNSLKTIRESGSLGPKLMIIIARLVMASLLRGVLGQASCLCL